MIAHNSAAPNPPLHTQGYSGGVTLATIRDAFAAIRGAICCSPCAESHVLSEKTGGKIFLKLENLQRTGAFKERGAVNKLLNLSAEQRQKGLVTASAGNHGQAVAYHATRLGIGSEVWMPLGTPLVKVSATRAYGAEVVLHGMNFDETYSAAEASCRERGATFIHPFDDDAIIAGQGTISLELVAQVSRLDTVIVPVGGGGLIGGMAVALKESNPQILVVGVQTSALPSMAVALTAGKPVPVSPSVTIADGIAVRCVGERTLPLVRSYVDDIVLVDEEEIANAVLFLLEREKTLAEGGGAVGVAALLHRKINLENKTAAVVVSGGNMDVNLLSRIIERGLVKDGRLIRWRIPLPDHPGALHRLTEVIAAKRVNIVETSYDRAFCGAKLGHTVIDLTMETRGRDHVEVLFAALEQAGYSPAPAANGT